MGLSDDDLQEGHTAAQVVVANSVLFLPQGNPLFCTVRQGRHEALVKHLCVLRFTSLFIDVLQLGFDYLFEWNCSVVVNEFLLDWFDVVSHLQRDVKDAIRSSQLVSSVLNVFEEVVEAVGFGSV